MKSGIHQDGMLKHTQTYEIMTPESVGVKQTSLVMGKHSGRHAFVHKLKDLGYELAGNQLEDAFVRFKALADRKKHVYDEDIEALVDEEIATAQDRIKLVSLSIIAGTHGPQRATMKLDIDGRTAIEEREGNGPVDATFNCIKALVPHDAHAGTLSGACRDRGNRRASRSLGAAVRERQVGHRQRRRPRHPGCLR